MSFINKFRNMAVSSKNKKRPLLQKKQAEESDKENKPDNKVRIITTGLEDLIRRPHSTEKSATMVSDNKYVFLIDKNANKVSVKKAVSVLYNVKVNKVNIISNISKKVRVGKYIGRKAAIKKAIVTLSQGNKIESL